MNYPLWRVLVLFFIGLGSAFDALAANTNIFPILAWNPVPHDLAYLKTMRECGFTIAGFAPLTNLSLCRKAGLQALVSDARVSDYNWTNIDLTAARKNITSLARKTAHDPAVYGYFVQDEPGADLYPGLATIVSLLRERAPGKWAYINLFPDYASADQMNVPTYNEYVQKFCDVCRPAILSYDHYSLPEDGSFRPLYWKNIEAMRTIALSNGLPFWNTILSEGHLTYREPTINDLRLEAYSSLAYGARGISWFQYSVTPIGNWRGAAVDGFGHTTATWDWLRNVNLQIAVLGPTMLKLRSDDVYHIGTVPDGCHKPGENDLISGIDGGDYAVGDFTHKDGTRYVMVVNKSLTRSAPCFPKYRASWKNIKSMSPYTGEWMTPFGESCWLAPGQGMLFKLD